MTNTTGSQPTANNNPAPEGRKNYPGIEVKCHGTLANLTQGGTFGAPYDGGFAIFGGTGT